MLTDDDFSTIVGAIHEGRKIDANIRKFVAFLLSANLGEVVVFAIAVLAGLGVPMTVVQVLAVNLLTDGLPAVALSRDPAPADVMRRPPRRVGGLFTRQLALALALAGTAVGLAATGPTSSARARARSCPDDDVLDDRACGARPRLCLALVLLLRRGADRGTRR